MNFTNHKDGPCPGKDNNSHHILQKCLFTEDKWWYICLNCGGKYGE